MELLAEHLHPKLKAAFEDFESAPDADRWIAREFYDALQIFKHEFSVASRKVAQMMHGTFTPAEHHTNTNTLVLSVVLGCHAAARALQLHDIHKGRGRSARDLQVETDAKVREARDALLKAHAEGRRDMQCLDKLCGSELSAGRLHAAQDFEQHKSHAHIFGDLDMDALGSRPILPLLELPHAW